MKSASSVALIICGVFLFIVPAMADAYRAMLLARLLEHGVSGVTIEGEMGVIYRIACVVVAVVLLLVGVIGSVSPDPSTNSSTDDTDESEAAEDRRPRRRWTAR